jgi:hypothetical protein
MKRFVVTVLWLAACGGHSTPAPTASGPPAALQPTPAAGDVQVATVNGAPVWGSCVSAQAAHGISKQEALDECIAFELLAQAAEARGLALDPDVRLDTRTALVSQLVAKDFEDAYQKPGDFGPLWDALYQKNRHLYEHNEFRGSAYIRAVVPKNATPEQDAKAKAVADEIAAAVANERGLMPQHLIEIGERVAAGRVELFHETVIPYGRTARADPAYIAALFSIPEVGRTAPTAVRTAWGWDVILLNDLIPAARPSADEVTKQMLPDVKRTFFPQWTNQIAQRLGTRIEIEQQNLSLMENL